MLPPPWSSPLSTSTGLSARLARFQRRLELRRKRWSANDSKPPRPLLRPYIASACRGGANSVRHVALLLPYGSGYCDIFGQGHSAGWLTNGERGLRRRDI